MFLISFQTDGRQMFNFLMKPNNVMKNVAFQLHPFCHSVISSTVTTQNPSSSFRGVCACVNDCAHACHLDLYAHVWISASLHNARELVCVCACEQ